MTREWWDDDDEDVENEWDDEGWDEEE